MNFTFSKEQIDLNTQASAFAQANLNTALAHRDKVGSARDDSWRDLWAKVADYGIFGLCFDPAYGGAGHDVVTTIGILEALGQGCADNGLTLGINGQIWAAQEPINSFGTPAQKSRYLSALISGKMIGAHGLTEVETGSDAMAMQTTALKQGDGYLLQGAKTLVGMGPVCDLAVVFAKTAPEKGQWGISAFLVEAADAGFGQGDHQEKMGTRTAPMGPIDFTDCWVPADRLLGSEGAGLSIFQHTMEWERSFIFASHVGSMARQLDAAVRFARQRKTFGQPVIAHQSVSNRIADMKVRLETSRLLLYKQAAAMDAGTSTVLDAATSKLHISEAFVASSLDAIRIHGGAGYLSDTGIERDLRDAIGGVIYSGTSDIQRQIIARLLP